MITKKILMFVSLFVFATSVSFAMTEKQQDDVFDQEIQEQEGNHSSELKKARKYYFEGNLEKAELILDAVPDNEKANELRNKILLIKEKQSYYKKSIVNDYLIELRRTVKDGNYYEGFLYVKKIKELSDTENLEMFENRLNSEKELTLYTIESNSDKKLLLNSIEYFVNEKFTKSTNAIRKLYEKYPKFEEFLGISRAYIIKEANNDRIKQLYSKSVKNLKATKLGAARNYAEMAYNLDPNNLKLKILLDQINMEIL